MTDHHVLVLTGPCEECEGTDHFVRCEVNAQHTYDFTVRCPGVSDGCRAWTECRECSSDDVKTLVEDGEGSAHGVEHRWLAGVWAVPTEMCFVQTSDSLADEVYELDLSPGEHPMTFTVEDDEYLVLTPVRDER